MLVMILLAIGFGIGAPQTPATPEAFSYVPRTSWEYRALASIERDGIRLLPNSDCIAYGGPKGGRTLTRYEIAVGIDRTMRTVEERRLTSRFAGALHTLAGGEPLNGRIAAWHCPGAVSADHNPSGGALARHLLHWNRRTNRSQEAVAEEDRFEGAMDRARGIQAARGYASQLRRLRGSSLDGVRGSTPLARERSGG